MYALDLPGKSPGNRAGRKTMAEKQIKVLIVDDHSAVRAGIKNLLQAAKDIVVVGEGGTGAEAIELVATKESDILLLDIELPDQRGDAVTRQIREIQPDMKVLAVSSYSDRDYILGMIESGAAGYITKDEAPTLLVDAIRSIVNKPASWFSPQVVKNSSPTSIEEQTLTQREVQILEQLILDRGVDEIAASLGINAEKLGRHLRLLMSKFETESLVSLRHIARQVLSRRSS